LTRPGGRRFVARSKRNASSHRASRSRWGHGVAAALAVAVLASCTSGTTGATSTSPPPTELVVAPGAELPEGRGLVADELDGTRTVTSSWGTVTVPLEPKRVVSVAGDIDFEAMLALGVTPVGAGTPHGLPDEDFAPHLARSAAGVEPLAWADGVSHDAVARLRPDLIFAPDERTADLLSDIAPAVPRGSWVGTAWKQDFRYVAAVLGREDEAAERLSDWEHRALKVQSRIADVMDGRTVASPQLIIDPVDIRVDSPDAFSSAVLLELGLDLAPVAMKARSTDASLPLHRLNELDADVLFWRVGTGIPNVADSTALELARGNPLWPSLPAVQADAVFEVDSRSWGSPTILSAERILTDIERALA
jgi:iron complex transport system substrate-binding protein